MSAVLFHCPCLSPLSTSRPPPTLSSPTLASYSSLSSLLFCEECDAIRCDTCVAVEISCFYCPSCLFEVPSASVRGEKNRCARNCFECPQCSHTLAVVASDTKEDGGSSSIGTAPFFLSCAFCHWDSKEVGIVFEKPTGLALQLQKQEDSAPSQAEFEHLKQHFEPYLRQGHQLAQTSTSSGLPTSNIALATRPSLAGTRYGSMMGLAGRGKEMGGGRDELGKYESLQGRGKGKGVEQEDWDGDRVRIMRDLRDVEEVKGPQKRWGESWESSILASDLRPQRTPLQSKRSKRCPTCKHILIKPEQKASSTRFKIKLVASNYLPSIEVYRRPPTTLLNSRLGVVGTPNVRRAPRTAPGRSVNDVKGLEEEPLRPGRTYAFELGFTNPLFEPIQVKIAIARPAAQSIDNSPVEGPPAYAVNIPSPHFPISAFAEEWEYEDEEMMAEEEEGGDGGTARKKKRGGAGIVERKMNRTTVLLEVAVGKDTIGPIKANMLVTYIYQNEDANAPPPLPPKSPVKGATVEAVIEDVKSFSFWTLFNLGTIVPRPVAAVDSRRGPPTPARD